MTNNPKHKLNCLRPGMTMIELLVAVSVLAILILIFGRVLSQSQRVVTGAQELMKFNAGSTAAANTLKKDIQKISNTSFLYIVNDYVDVTVNGTSQRWPRAKMYMGITGSFASWSNPAIDDGSGAIIGVGLCNQNAIPDDDKPKLLWRNRCIMTTNAAAPITPQLNNDTWQHSFADTETPTAGISKRYWLLNTWLNPIINNTAWSPTGMTIPPSTIDDVNMIWKYLMPNVNKLSIMWTKGDTKTTDPKALIWYGIDIDGRLHLPKGTTSGSTIAYGTCYTNNNPARIFDDTQMPAYTSNSSSLANAIYTDTAGTSIIYPAKFEFPHSYTTNGTTHSCYCALWNSELSTQYWPTAIKITYEVTDGKATNPTTKTYEIICNTAISN